MEVEFNKPLAAVDQATAECLEGGMWFLYALYYDRAEDATGRIVYQVRPEPDGEYWGRIWLRQWGADKTIIRFSEADTPRKMGWTPEELSVIDALPDGERDAAFATIAARDRTARTERQKAISIYFRTLTTAYLRALSGDIIPGTAEPAPNKTADNIRHRTEAEVLALLREMHPTLAEVATGVRDLQAGQERILARFDQQEQRILAPILARLNTQQAEQTAAILDALDARIFPADELGRHLAVIQMALAELNIRATQMGDRQLAESARQVTEFASAPGLDVKHKLKLTVPIVPLFLSYEGAFEWGDLNLKETWRAIQGWISDG